MKGRISSAAAVRPTASSEAVRTANLKFTGLTQNLGQLQGSYRDFQSNFWVVLRILGQPCEFPFTAQASANNKESFVFIGILLIFAVCQISTTVLIIY